jgi:GNAT superfamily N-acetyltransferase
MECIQYQKDLLPALTNLVNSQVASIPPGWTFSEEQVSNTINLAGSLWSIHFPDQTAVFKLETLCMVDGGKLLAAAQWGYPVDRKGIDNSGILFWILAETTAGSAMSMLLDVVKAHSRMAGNPRVLVTRYSFGVGWLGIPATWQHVTGALQSAGFIPRSRWAVFTGSVNSLEMDKPDGLQAMQTVWLANENSHEWDLQVHDGVYIVGECSAWGIPQHFSGCPGYENWITFEWIGVEPGYQRKGMGRWLLSEQLRRQAGRGITNAILWTETKNLPALELNHSMGFKPVFECWEFEVVNEI